MEVVITVVNVEVHIFPSVVYLCRFKNLAIVSGNTMHITLPFGTGFVEGEKD